MVSNLSTIGFEFADDEDFQAAMQRLAAEAFERLASDVGDYAIWRSRTGCEIWFHIIGERAGDGTLADRAVVGLTPFFEGLSDVPLEIAETVIRPADNDFEGAFLAWVEPDEETGVGAHQIVFDAVDFAAHCDRPMPFLARARLVGFARAIRLLAAEDRVARARASSGARAFLPLGLFGERNPAGEGAPAAPSSNATLTGTVAEHSRLTNEETGCAYHWLLVRSASAAFDIVADEEIVPDEIAPGQRIEVDCLMFGRLLG